MALFLFGAGPTADYLRMKKKAFYAYEHGKPQEAVQRVKAYIDVHPESLYAKNLLAVLYYWQGERAKAREILERIVAKDDFPQAKRLLAQIEKGVKRTTGVHISEKKQVSVPKKSGDVRKRKEDDLAFLQQYILEHPNDVDARKVLLNYYLSLNDDKHATQIAQELLRIDPDDVETLGLVKSEKLKVAFNYDDVHSDARRDKVVALLHTYQSQRDYRRYINLYQAFANQKAYLPRYVHLEALDIAVQLREYRLARRILLENDFPATSHLRELRALLDRKLKVAFSR